MNLSIEELRKFFETTLVPDLQTLENQRKKVANKLIRLNVLCLIVLIVLITLFFIVIFMGIKFYISINVGITLVSIVIFIWIFSALKIKKGYVSNFKTEVIARIIKFVDKTLNYSATNCIPQSVYMSSKIFRIEPDSYTGDDLVSGTIDKTNFSFSYIHSKYKVDKSEWQTIFSGLFFVADFNKKFKCETFVFPDVAQRMFGNVLGNIFQSLNESYGELVKMEDPEFEKYFVVYSNDQIGARYILSTSLMKRIVDYRKKGMNVMYLSFVDNKVSIAISKSLFEPKIFKTLLDFNIIKEYYEDLQMTISIIEKLNLNTRIWSKK